MVTRTIPDLICSLSSTVECGDPCVLEFPHQKRTTQSTYNQATSLKSPYLKTMAEHSLRSLTAPVLSHLPPPQPRRHETKTRKGGTPVLALPAPGPSAPAAAKSSCCFWVTRTMPFRCSSSPHIPHSRGHFRVYTPLPSNSMRTLSASLPPNLHWPSAGPESRPRQLAFLFGTSRRADWKRGPVNRVRSVLSEALPLWWEWGGRGKGQF